MDVKLIEKVEVEILERGFVGKNNSGQRIAFEDHTKCLKEIYEKIDSDVVGLINKKAKGFVVEFIVYEAS